MIRARQFQCGGVMGRKETEEAIADSRAGRVTQFGSVAELMADLNADDTPDQVRARYMSSHLSRPQAAMGCAVRPISPRFVAIGPHIVDFPKKTLKYGAMVTKEAS